MHDAVFHVQIETFLAFQMKEGAAWRALTFYYHVLYVGGDKHEES
jgi:hypothetical protein